MPIDPTVVASQLQANHDHATNTPADRLELERLAALHRPDPGLERELATEDRIGADAYAAAGRNDFQSNARRAGYRQARDAHRQLEELRQQEAARS